MRLIPLYLENFGLQRTSTSSLDNVYSVFCACSRHNNTAVFCFRPRGRITALLTHSLFRLYFELLKLKYKLLIMTMRSVVTRFDEM